MDGLSNAAREKERAASLAFCRDTINRISDKGLLQRAHIETLISERVRLGKLLIGRLKFPKMGQMISCHYFLTGLLQSLLQTVRPQGLRIAGPRGVDRSAQGEHEVSDDFIQCLKIELLGS